MPKHLNWGLKRLFRPKNILRLKKMIGMCLNVIGMKIE